MASLRATLAMPPEERREIDLRWSPGSPQIDDSTDSLDR
jgi:hypothetical protein